MNIKERYTFSCWVVKYNRVSIMGKMYKQNALRSSDKLIVPLLWEHRHNDPTCVLGQALLEHREDGVYVYCLLNDSSYKDIIIQMLRDKGSVALSPYINKVESDEKYIKRGIIREVSLVFKRVDPDESYYPVLREGV